MLFYSLLETSSAFLIELDLYSRISAAAAVFVAVLHIGELREKRISVIYAAAADLQILAGKHCFLPVLARYRELALKGGFRVGFAFYIADVRLYSYAVNHAVSLRVAVDPESVPDEIYVFSVLSDKFSRLSEKFGQNGQVAGNIHAFAVYYHLVFRDVNAQILGRDFRLFPEKIKKSHNFSPFNLSKFYFNDDKILLRGSGVVRIIVLQQNHIAAEKEAKNRVLALGVLHAVKPRLSVY